VRKITRRKWNKTKENTGEELHKQEIVERKKEETKKCPFISTCSGKHHCLSIHSLLF